MTNVGARRKNKTHFTEAEKTRMNRSTVISDSEFQNMLNNAAEIKHDFMRLRTLAVLCLLRLTGKRREEIALLRIGSITLENKLLNVTFTLLKKRKGSVLQRQAIKSIPVSDPLVQPILMYLGLLQKFESKPMFFFPRAKTVFGDFQGIYEDSHISGRQVFNIVRSLSASVWPHLFRETVGADVIKQDSSIIGAFKVMRRLDLKDYRTGFNYLYRYAGDVIRREEEKLRASESYT